MDIHLIPVSEQEKQTFISDVQEAFQVGYEEKCGPCPETILPTEDIEASFQAKGAEAYFAVSDGEIVGGVIIVIDRESNQNHLDLLYVKVGCQSRGTGQAIWRKVEALHPETEVWETHTPYFEKRNIHFYVNRLAFILWSSSTGGIRIHIKRESLRAVCRKNKATTFSGLKSG